MDEQLQLILDESGSLHAALNACLHGVRFTLSSRGNLTLAAGDIAIEHGESVARLLAAGNLTSAVVLLRAQFEAATRAIWLHYVATDDWVEKFLKSIPPGTQKDPNNTPGMDVMLAAIDEKAPAEVGRMLRALKDGAWAALNSYVHTGLHPMLQYHLGYPPEYAIQTIRNANGLSTMGAMIIAVLSGQSRLTKAIKEVQLSHLHCLPPLAGDSPPP